MFTNSRIEKKKWYVIYNGIYTAMRMEKNPQNCAQKYG